jgi:hypothetical protein
MMKGSKEAIGSVTQWPTQSARATIEREISNLSRAIAAGGPLEPLLVELKDRQQRRDDTIATLAARESVERRRVNRTLVERHVRQRVADWRALLTTHVADGRQLLREVLAGPIRFAPDDETYRFEGEAAMGRLLGGTIGLAPFLASPTGPGNSDRLRGLFRLAA